MLEPGPGFVANAADAVRERQHGDDEKCSLHVLSPLGFRVKGEPCRISGAVKPLAGVEPLQEKPGATTRVTRARYRAGRERRVNVMRPPVVRPAAGVDLCRCGRARP